MPFRSDCAVLHLIMKCYVCIACLCVWIVTRPRCCKFTASSIDSFAPKVEADFVKLGQLMHAKLRPFEGTKGHLQTLKGLLRATADNMSTDDCKDLATFVSTISNEKLKADRDKNKPKPKGKLKGKLAAGKANDMDFDDDDPFS